MRTVVTFRVTELQAQVLEQAEKIIQKPRGEILAAMIEKNLQQTLIELVKAGARPKPFTPPAQRMVKRKPASNAQNNSG